MRPKNNARKPNPYFIWKKKAENSFPKAIGQMAIRSLVINRDAKQPRELKQLADDIYAQSLRLGLNVDYSKLLEQIQHYAKKLPKGLRVGRKGRGATRNPYANQIRIKSRRPKTRKKVNPDEVPFTEAWQKRLGKEIK